MVCYNLDYPQPIKVVSSPVKFKVTVHTYHSQNLCLDNYFSLGKLCYVAVCNNYAICNKLQTALNGSAVCNTSYFKLRCDGKAICNVLQIASKVYHLKILKRRKKLINGKMHRFNHILLWIQSDTNLFELGMQKSKSTLQFFRTLFCTRTFAKWGGDIKTHLSVRLLVCLPITLSVAKILT